MEHEFWRDRWQEGKIGFHEAQPNAYLVRHGAWLADHRRVLVPLCGKTNDLAYLAAHGHEVIGIELVEDAVKQFFAEHSLTPEVTTAGTLQRYTSGVITVFAGDFFAATPALVGPIDAIFDRAALVALPAHMRVQYIEHLRTLAPDARRELLVSLEYPQELMEGPPFNVDQAEVRGHFAGHDVQHLESGVDPRGRLDGKLVEHCYAIAFKR